MFKKIISYILGLLLTISLFLLIVVLIIFNTLGNKNYMLNMLDKNNYYNFIYSDIKKNIKGYTIQLGIDDTTLESLYSKDKVKKDINILVDGIYDNKNIVIDTTEITDKLEEIINNKLKENNRQATSDEEAAIKELKKDISSVYESEITFSTKYAQKIGNAYFKVNKYRNTLLYLLSGVSVFLFLLIIIVNRNIGNILKNCGVSVLSVGFLLILINLLLKNKFQNILILNSIFSKFVIFIINDIFKICFIFGIVLVIISVVEIIIGSILKCREK